VWRTVSGTGVLYNEIGNADRVWRWLGRMTEEIVKQLEAYVASIVAPVAVTGLPVAAWTVGVEHECFVVDASGGVVDHAQSQALLQNLSALPGWTATHAHTVEFGEMIVAVARDSGRPFATTVKLDHHPHLLEIAFSYYDTLHALAEEVRSVLSLVERAAARANLRLATTSVLPRAARRPWVESELPLFRSLRHYRALLLRRRGIVSPELQNYAAFIAATQTHVGGLAWWTRPQLVANLLLLESSFGAWPSAAATAGNVQARWHGYSEVFEGHPLAGFPNLDDWDIPQWLSALGRSPLAAGPEHTWAGESLSTAGARVDLDAASIFDAIRDLQIIRPRPRLGTVEFRADPAQPTADAIVATAALRLAGCIAADLGEVPARSFVEARTHWWQRARSGVFPVDERILDTAARLLHRRGHGEEQLVRAFVCSDAA